MNEKTVAAPPKGLEEGSATYGPHAPTGELERRTCLTEELRGADLRGQDLTGIEGLLPEHLAGADLTGAKLPDEIAKFPALDQVAAISSEARKIFIGLLAACVYSWLVIGTTTDVALIVNTASSPLPIINTAIPIADFYWVGSTILAAVYCYLHLYLLRLWRALASLPAIFPDGTAIDDKTDPWLLTGLVRTYMSRTPARPLGYVENGISVLLAWLLVPITLFFYWWRLLPAHHLNRLLWLAWLIAFTTFIGWRTFHLARTTLQGQLARGNRARTLLSGSWRDFHASSGEIAVFCLVVPFVFGVSSMFACWQSPRDPDTNSVVVFSPYAAWQSVREVDPTPAKLLNFVGIRTYADLREADVTARPEGWDGKDWSKVKRVDLRGRNLAFADATRAFFAKADLRGANLREARLAEAQLQGADLTGAQLQGANLSLAQLQGAELMGAQLQGGDLSGALLKGAHLSSWRLDGSVMYTMGSTSTQLQGADLSGAELQGADLRDAQLQGANLSLAGLQGADFYTASLQGANLSLARLQGADLARAELQAADLRLTEIWRAQVNDALWDLADLRFSSVEPMSDSDIDILISQTTKDIPDEGQRTAIAQALTAALRTAKRPPRPGFPEKWRSEPNVMFERGDPKPERFDWGPRKWATDYTYDEDLAKFLGDLACSGDAPEAQTRGLARRALAPIDGEHGRFWPGFFAKQITGPDCPAAKRLPDDMRRTLEQLATRGDAAVGSPPGSPPDPVE